RLLVAACGEKNGAPPVQLRVINRLGMSKGRQVCLEGEVPNDSATIGAGADEMLTVAAPTQIANDQLMSVRDRPNDVAGLAVSNGDRIRTHAAQAQPPIRACFPIIELAGGNGGDPH